MRMSIIWQRKRYPRQNVIFFFIVLVNENTFMSLENTDAHGARGHASSNVDWLLSDLFWYFYYSRKKEYVSALDILVRLDPACAHDNPYSGFYPFRKGILLYRIAEWQIEQSIGG